MSLKCGSGVFIRKNKILTAFHVVSDVYLDPALPPVHPQISILRESGEKFEYAVLLSSYPAYDIAILKVDGIAPEVILSDKSYRGERVWAVGNPGGRDFKVVETTITGIDIIGKPNFPGTRELLELDSKKNLITHGFSGGGIFSDTGMIGILQLCSDQLNTCLAMPTSEIEKQIKGDLK